METSKRIQIKALLRNSDYVIYWFSKAASSAASNVIQFALALYILDLTGSATIFATALAIIILPRILLTPIAGVLGDRYTRIKMMYLLTLASTFILACFTYASYSNNGLTLWGIFTLVVLLETVEVFYQGPACAIIPELVSEELIAEGVSLAQIDESIIRTLAPVFAGLIYTKFSITGSLLAACLCFLLASILRFFIHPKYASKKDSSKKKDTKKEFLEGLKILKENRRIIRFIILFPFINFFLGGIFYVTISYLLITVYGVTPEVYSLYLAATACVGIFVPFLAIPITKRYSPESILYVAISAEAFLMALMALTVFLYGISYENMRFLIVSITLLACFSVAFMTTCNISTSTFFQTTIPDEFRSRVMSVFLMVVLTSVPLGQLAYGLLSDCLPSYAPIFISTIGLTVCAILIKKICKPLKTKSA